MFRTAYSRFRGGLLSLACNEGRYNNNTFVERVCLLCKRGIETEFDFLLVCPNLRQIRLNIFHSFGTHILLLINLFSCVHL